MKKRTSMSLTIFFFTLSTLLISLSSCGGSGTNSSFSLPSMGGAPSVEDGVDGNSDGITDPTQFYIGVKSDGNILAHVRAASSFTSKCSIAPTASNTDIACYIDVPEGDLYTNDLTMIYNIPPNMCRYMRRTPYWYYNHEVGVGPTSITMNITQNASGDVTAYTCGINGGAPGSCSGLAEANVNQTTRTATCVYDKRTSSGANCCFGNYTLTKNVTTPTSTLSESANNSWGGNYSSCIGGPGKSNWTAFSTSGLPIPILEKTRAGVVGEFTVTAPISNISSQSTISVSNYYNPTLHTHVGFVLPRSTNKPYYLDPVDDRSGTAISPANDLYSFDCLDEAFELKHRIRVTVREWDTYPDFLNYLSSSGVIVVPDRGITTEPGGCIGIEGPCNDHFDADDFLTAVIGTPSYDMSAPAIPNRGNYFPSLQ